MPSIAQIPSARNGTSAPVIPQGPATLPEAALSFNVFVETALGRVQVTARGWDETEAVARLRQGVVALHKHAKPDPFLILSTCLARGLARAQQQGDLALAKRLLCAVQIVLADGFARDEYGQITGVYSQHDGVVVYALDSAGRCPCPSAVKLHPALCKHALSVALMARMEGR